MSFDEENFPDLPATWTIVSVEDACENLPVKYKVQNRNYKKTGILPVVDQGADLIGGYTDELETSVTDSLPVIVFGDHTRAIKFIDFEFAAGADGIKVLAPNSCFVPPLFYRFIQSVKLPDKGYARHYQHLRSSRLALPPFNEQKRIADKLDTLLKRVDACRDRLDRVPLILKRFRQAVLIAATSGALTEDWREMNCHKVSANALSKSVRDAHFAAGGHKMGNAAAPTQDVHDLMPEMFPCNWDLHELRDLVRPDRPITYGILKPGPELAEGIPYIRVADFPNDNLNVTTVRKTSSVIDYEFRRSRLLTGDILLSIRGTVGRLVVIPPELEGANITQDSARLSIQQQINRDYVLWYLRSNIAQQRMKRSEKGVAVRGINIGDVRALQIALPSRDEQDEIVRRVEKLFTFADKLEARYAMARKQVEQLTPALLAKAFRGELVEQDPNDEPAAVLLERIKAEREEQATVHRLVPRRIRRNTYHSEPEPLPMVAEPATTYGLQPPQRVLAAMQTGRDYSRADLLTAARVKESEWLWAIRQLKDEGLVIQSGERRGARYRRK